MPKLFHLNKNCFFLSNLKIRLIIFTTIFILVLMCSSMVLHIVVKKSCCMEMFLVIVTFKGMILYFLSFVEFVNKNFNFIHEYRYKRCPYKIVLSKFSSTSQTSDEGFFLTLIFLILAEYIYICH